MFFQRNTFSLDTQPLIEKGFLNSKKMKTWSERRVCRTYLNVASSTRRSEIQEENLWNPRRRLCYWKEVEIVPKNISFLRVQLALSLGILRIIDLYCTVSIQRDNFLSSTFEKKINGISCFETWSTGHTGYYQNQIWTSSIYRLLKNRLQNFIVVTITTDLCYPVTERRPS